MTAKVMEIISALTEKNRRTLTFPKVEEFKVEIRTDTDGYIDFSKCTLNVTKIKVAPNIFNQYHILKMYNGHTWYNVTFVENESATKILSYIDSLKPLNRNLK